MFAPWDPNEPNASFQERLESENDFEAMQAAVNRSVGTTVLVIVPDAGRYRCLRTSYDLGRRKVEWDGDA